VGTLPAEIWGWVINPISSKSAMMFRIVAGLKWMPLFFEIAFEPTGSAVSI
jgi:hypothetical protein